VPSRRVEMLADLPEHQVKHVGSQSSCIRVVPGTMITVCQQQSIGDGMHPSMSEGEGRFLVPERRQYHTMRKTSEGQDDLEVRHGGNFCRKERKAGL